ncbi:MAG TPA: GNAT family N-acetyltransferase [Steroidobacteraceae bacterium]|nr:GNAT family N-acetyltransferase [Steroidobacteraceae bacterium]
MADQPQAAVIVAHWYFQQWGHLRAADDEARVLERLQEYQNRDRIPLMLLAMAADHVVGAAQLKIREMQMFPEREHWLGGVFVAPPYRGRGFASQLIARVVRLAQQFGVGTLHLQTERLDGGLYARLGWQPSQQVTDRGRSVLIMQRALPRT